MSKKFTYVLSRFAGIGQSYLLRYRREKEKNKRVLVLTKKFILGDKLRVLRKKKEYSDQENNVIIYVNREK